MTADTSDPLDLEPLHVLLGPTASGKSSLGLQVAEQVGAEIISLDSMQVYRGMDIGTAKPSVEDLARVP
ncbi:MAG: isopentenyl transferase family protein, partial [Planctomycetota bacterium]|nr:isopentenyl transferase family protein [Planctomycetota bacterium]